MKSKCQLILASLLVCNLTACRGQSVSDEEETSRMAGDDIGLQKAKSLLLRSILQKMQEDDRSAEGSSSQTEWMTKRQHPGKRHGEHPEKRQHPGRREEAAGERRSDSQKRQHPGKRSATERASEPMITLLGELSKRQHPGKRYRVLHGERRHPGARRAEDEDRDEGDEDPAELERRQHPGKRFWSYSNPDSGTVSPCDASNPARCSKASLLLDFFHNINKSRAEEKRQHPGKRFAPEEVKGSYPRRV
ncbi:pro-thyrotropin-releasing hormone [Brachionichthys hirsutus]|uniref:pro-thyrotropin-releasing hormone n=1 Tax=Brachionichthys hirsutus TaxID=412623 RepID=UPI0036045898